MPPLAVIVNILADDVTDFVHKELTKTSKDADFMYIDCKYYTASIKLKKFNESEPKSTIGEADAIVVCFDPDKPEGFKIVSNWLAADEGEDIPVRLLVCKTLPDNKIRTDVFKMATDNHFEVIQLSPDPDEIEKDEEYGINRVLSALAAHQWPGLILKDSKMEQHSTVLNGNSRTKPKISSTNEIEEKEEKEIIKSDEKKGMESEDEEFDDEAFIELFPKLMEMRSKAVGLDFDKRRKMAEKLTVRFWRSMKLDDDEISGLSDDGEN
ncbi:hypothetical protein Aperf_G00000001670 [Anoplocephala perfoliata]